MKTRRHWIASMLATSAVAGCGADTSRARAPTPRTAAAPTPTSLEPWDPIDPAFDGCAGG